MVVVFRRTRGGSAMTTTTDIVLVALLYGLRRPQLS
jgi:hypothetical protein